MVPAVALMLMLFVVAPAPRSARRLPRMTTSPLFVVMTAGFTPAAIWSVEDTMTLPAIGAPAVMSALVSSVPVVGAEGSAGAAGAEPELPRFIPPDAKARRFAPRPPVPTASVGVDE